MSNKIQKYEMYLPGNLGTMRVGDEIRGIKSLFLGKDGSVTITMGATDPKPLLVNGHQTGISFYLPEKTIDLPPLKI